ncbi:glutathionylspermidine synthase family protein [Chitinophaga sp. 212800010-3]|uniref:glutathionylspermidine synthase family protein n=1 Tax=unclassified Chitinophaga TaxID=2619133 RepID=UPI002DF127D8|nr:GSP-synth domain-containing protein [Chitinophaga sp. 212800010-3]
MKRINITQRNNWEDKIKQQGFVYYKDYYNEDAAYEFTAAQVDDIETATNEIFDMCLKVVEHVIDNNLWKEFFIPEQYAELIKWSWNEDMMSFYGRMDLAYDGRNIKLLEFNADTPTGLLEASVIQWYWLEDYNKSLDQFNSIHEKLLAHMQVCKPYFLGDKMFFSSVSNSEEDYITVKYLQDIADQAGIKNDFLYIEDISINDAGHFCTKDGQPIENIFKLYPYEWMFHEEFGTYLTSTKENCYWVEPAYKALLSNKMLLKWLYKLFPDSPYILPCEYGKPLIGDYVRKPVFSREGANIQVVKNGIILEETTGDYGEEGYLYQQYFDIPRFNGFTPVIGSWLIGGVAAGMGIRESQRLITDNMSKFAPHYFAKIRD